MNSFKLFCGSFRQNQLKRFGAGVLAAVLLAGGVGICHGAPAIKPDELKVDGMQITLVGKGETLTVEPLVPKHAEMTGKLKVGKPDWFAGYRLANVGWIYRALNRYGPIVLNPERHGHCLCKHLTITKNLVGDIWTSSHLEPECAETTGKQIDAFQAALQLSQLTF